MATIQFIETGSTYFICYAAGLNSTVGVARIVEWWINDIYVTRESISATATSSAGVQLSGLSSSTIYKITVKIYYSGGSTVVDSATTTAATAAGSGGTVTYPVPLISTTSTSNTITVTVSNMLAGVQKMLMVWVNGSYYPAGGINGLTAAYWTFNLTGLTAQTLYTIQVTVQYDTNGDLIYDLARTASTSATTSAATLNAVIDIDENTITTTSVSFWVYEFNAENSVRSIGYSINKGSVLGEEVNSGTVYINSGTVGRLITEDGLEPNTTYVISVNIVCSGYPTVTLTESFTTSAGIAFTPTGTIEVTSTTANSISVKVTNLSNVTGCRPIEISFYLEMDGNLVQDMGTATIPATSSATATNIVTFSGLQKSTLYDVHCYIVYKGMAGVAAKYELDVYKIAVSTLAGRPATFSWTYTKTQGGTFNLTATEWNNLITNVNDVRTYKGLSTYSCTSATKGSTFYYYMYNQLANAINEVYYNSFGSRPISTVSSGDTVTALALNNLVTYINKIT